ncbi:alkylation response protein AidB-like acyl-CoA dehydrogenase [Streptosporangium album]|uniref:Alkylation response protein AidB-like acyl-CoA dehydrogenase n=1 Tax=Streptosporangium album TaxID=47479 RepID=A0A7W7RQ84_9ACTN|nr:acyl-CoA dehydrogenase family protein [Streptosporangium album]MBB4936160.1 alkylation response protein AidB-like acyl-CoA dehydrogenase [Streptosporangium album]
MMTGDFYDYFELLDEAWTNARFPHRLIPEFAKLDIAGLPYRGARSLLTGFVVLEMNRVGPSMGTFFGVHNGPAMGSIDRLGSDEQRERWLPSMAAMEKIGAFALTEPDGGSELPVPDPSWFGPPKNTL